MRQDWGVRPARRALAGLAALLLLATACSDDEGGATGNGDPTSTRGRPPLDGPVADVDNGRIDECDWPMWGRDLSRSATTVCDTHLSPATVDRLEQVWFFRTDDVVTASPVVVDDTVYVGDWSGVVYAIDVESGTERWRFAAEPHPEVYAGQIVATAAVAGDGDDRLVYVGSGQTMYALDAATGTKRWSYDVGVTPERDDDTAEIESSAVVVDGMVVFGTDVHNRPGLRAGLYALDAATGELRWHYDPDASVEPRGCSDMWGSPSVDADAGLVFIGTGNCNRPDTDWHDASEALLAVELATGELAWTYQPHEPNNDDLDFAGTPNLFTADGRELVGLGNKDGDYYAVDRATGAHVWTADATGPGLPAEGSGFSTGGFIGAAAYDDASGTIVGGTAVGPAPFLHGIDATTGNIRWQQPKVEATYASTAISGGVAFVGGTDVSFRALDVATGEILWSTETRGVVAGGAAITGDSVFVPTGIRQPGTDGTSNNSGVYRYALDGAALAPTTSSTTTTTAATGPIRLEATDQDCLGRPCPVPFFLKDPPAGTNPKMTLEITPDPFHVHLEASGLGDPLSWIRPESPEHAKGATTYVAFLSSADDDPQSGGIVCELVPTPDGASVPGPPDPDGVTGTSMVPGDPLVCDGDSVPRPQATYTRFTVIAVADPDDPVTLVSGAARLVTTLQFDPPLRSLEVP